MARTVLIVDDAAFVRRLIRQILQREGYEVHEAVNGRDAVEKYAELRPDLVTLDLNMPVMDGMTALHEIRAFDPEATVVVVSAVRSANVVQSALSAGAVDYLTKPFQPARVVEAVKRCLTPSCG